MSKTRTLPSLLASAAVAGCTTYYPPQTVHVPAQVQEYPAVGTIYRQEQTSQSTMTWNAGGAMGPCVASQTTTRPLPSANAAMLQQMFNMPPEAAAAMRTGAQITCGYANPNAAAIQSPIEQGRRAMRQPKAALQGLALPPLFASLATTRGTYNLPEAGLQCRSSIVTVQPASRSPEPAPGVPMSTAPQPQFGNFTPDAGWAVPLGPVRDRYGNIHASSLICTQALTVQVPLVRPAAPQ